MKLFINKIEIPIKDNDFYQTKQINDIARLDDRQNSYTNTVKIPKTQNSVRAFKLLGITGNTSRVPYEFNEAELLSSNGQHFIYNGRAIINSSAKDYYEVTLYDGNADLFAEVQNSKLSEVNLTDLNHEKTVQNVINSMTSDLKYRYMLADFGGKTETNSGTVNIDYLSPFAYVPYIWDQIFAQYGYTYECETFNTSDWTNLWLSYPKGTFKSGTTTTVFKGNALGNVGPSTALVNFNTQSMPTVTTILQPIGDPNTGLINRLMCNQSGTYIIKIKGTITRAPLILGSTSNSFLWYCKNISSNNPNLVQPSGNLYHSFGTGLPLEQNVESSQVVQLTAGETLSLKWSALSRFEGFSSLEVEVLKYEADQIDFNDAFKGWLITDFIREIFVKFGLTFEKEKYSRHYKFYSTKQITNKNNVIDMSDKFVELVEERYVYENYAKDNLFKYKYHDDTEDHFNGRLRVENENLIPETTAFQSKTFAPSKMLLGDLVWQMYNREVKDNGEVDYKNLNDRFFFATSTKKATTPMIIASDYQTQKTVIQAIYNPVFKFQSWDYILSKYYSGIYRILSDSKIQKVNLRLTEIDILNFTMSKMIYIKQLSNFYVVNKIDKYNPKNSYTGVEIVKVEPYNPASDSQQPTVEFDDGVTVRPCILKGDLIPIRVKIDGIKPTDVVTLKPIGREQLTKINTNIFQLSDISEGKISILVNNVELNNLTIE